eukprot:TRINITY_DN20772_c0_g3_i2.p2 TRINITY_DN20772_c0_g3~~TRINITY_DN20772_c0_g3_i2.p2  ORF type:complete len:173 (-),score=38.13 TRINITY_DN20772_c0_g3_i2:172-690(-)
MGAGAKGPYFGDRPIYKTAPHPNQRNPYAAATMTIIASGSLSKKSRTPSLPSLRSGGSGSISRSGHSGGSRRGLAAVDVDLPFSPSASATFSPTNTFTHALDCHGVVCRDGTLNSLMARRAASAPSTPLSTSKMMTLTNSTNLDELLKTSRANTELYAGNVYKGSRSLLLGA